MMLTRRQFALGSAASVAFSGLAMRATAQAPLGQANGYGALTPDPAGLLDLPPGFSYRVISTFGERMADGHRVPDRADGMGVVPLANGRIALIRNHELQPRHHDTGPLRTPGPLAGAYDADKDGRALPGGATTLIYEPLSGRVVSEHLSLAGTIRNCAGGTTPWGSWLSCEETLTKAGDGVKRDHGWVFEVPASSRGLVPAQPLTALGRFNHEAAAVDPRTGIVYLTEDEKDGLFYRFLPNARGKLAAGGRLQALGFRDAPKGGDTRNWKGARNMTPSSWKQAVWVDLEGVDNPGNDLKNRGHAAGAAFFARGEGVHFGRGELYFMCTSGGPAELGQIFRYRPSRFEGGARERTEPGLLQLFLESRDKATLDYGDNIVVAPNGHLIVCEDQYTDQVDNHLRGITPAGRSYPLARLRVQTEPAGACFAPDGRTLFVNVYSPTKTLAITGPWESVV